MLSFGQAGHTENVLSQWKTESNKGWQWLGCPRRGKAAGRDRCSGAIQMEDLYYLGTSLGSVDQSTGCSENCILSQVSIKLWKKKNIFELAPSVLESQGLQAKGVLLELIE